MRTASRLAFVLFLLTSPAHAQLYSYTPNGGNQAGRATDTGHGSINASGGHSTSIPLSLPEARGDLPVPLSIVSGGRNVGAAGMGWDIPLSYVQVTRSVSRIRPRFAPGDPVQARERVILSLAGRVVEMVPRPNGEWVGRADGPNLILRQTSAAEMVLDDGAGRTWRFGRPQGDSGATPPENMYLLTQIRGHGAANRVELGYEIDWHTVQGTTAWSIDLESLRYNFHPTEPCAKHSVFLDYEDAPHARSLSFQGGVPMVRMTKLRTVSLGALKGCTQGGERLAQWTLLYDGGDPESGAPRLTKVLLTGRPGTSEGESPITLASYEYGAASRAGALEYHRQADVPIPAFGNALADTLYDDDIDLPGGQSAYVTRQSLVDLTCDGRPDFVYTDNGQLMIAVNRPSAADGSVTFDTPQPLANAPHPGGPLELHGKKAAYIQSPQIGGPVVIDSKWRGLLDWNADGCLDYVVADELPGRWVVYLNRTNESSIGSWRRLELDVTSLKEELEAVHGLDFTYVPLSRRDSFTDKVVKDCLEFHDGRWIQNFNGANNQACQLFPENQDPHFQEEDKHSFTLWDTRDVNGDGYPDVIFGSQPVRRELIPVPPVPIPDGYEGMRYFGAARHRLRVVNPDWNHLEIVYNVGGVRSLDGESPFSARDELFKAPHGVARHSGHGSNLFTIADLADVNGDGLVDYLSDDPVTPAGPVVLLNDGDRGFGVGVAPAAAIKIPSALHIFNNHDAACDAGSAGSAMFQLSGLRDLTGDGIPDLYQADVGINKLENIYVSVGNGSGFRIDGATHHSAYKPVALTVNGLSPDIQFAFWHQFQSCAGSLSFTDHGLYDLDGDGVPELVYRPKSAHVLQVYQLSANGGAELGAPSAKRITAIDNFYGARTTLTYASAKRDWKTRHQVPFPEIVVTKVETTGTRGLGSIGTKTLRAYGGAGLSYDPVRDRFLFPGYRRRVEIAVGPARADGQTFLGTATITETVPLPVFDPAMSDHDRWARHGREGRTARVLSLRGGFVADPTWLLLGVNGNDVRWHGESAATTSARLTPGTLPPTYDARDCADWVAPLDPAYSAAHAGGLAATHCANSGFLWTDDSSTWEGDQAPPSDENVQTRSRVLEVDSLGRPTMVFAENDVFDQTDDVCVLSSYAVPTLTEGRVLSAMATRELREASNDGAPQCHDTVLSRERWVYDKLAPGLVAQGRPTGHFVETRDPTTGLLLTPGVIETASATFDLVTGNVVEVVTERPPDTRSVFVDYDPFGLAATRFTTTSGNLPHLEVEHTLDPVTLETLFSTDPNGTAEGATYDGFGRPTRALVRAPGSEPLVVSTFEYAGSSPDDAQGPRTIVRKLSRAAPSAQAASAPATMSTTYRDELGRVRRTELRGAEAAMLVTETRYDELGRVKFATQPYLDGADPTKAYGTTHHYRPDGKLECSVDGEGVQPLVTTTDPAFAHLPTCYGESFAAHQRRTSVRDADALASSTPHERVTVSTAIGRTRSVSTWRNGVRLDHATHAYDRLGNAVEVTRYADAAAATGPVTTTRSVDSLGRTRSLTEPEAATRHFAYSAWGELESVRYLDEGVSPAVERRVTHVHDGYGRQTQTFEQAGGALVPGSGHLYFYDVEQTVYPEITAAPVAPRRNLKGRLAATFSPDLAYHVGYDDYGRPAQEIYTDRNGFVGVQLLEYQSGGSPTTLRLFLPDRGYAEDRIDYVLDLEGQLQMARYSAEGGEAKVLYEATETDGLGRLREAKLNGGTITFRSGFADSGRRLPESVTFESSQGGQTISYGTHDALGRETTRVETRTVGGVALPALTTSSVYDPLGRLSLQSRKINGTNVGTASFTFDPLGNITHLAESADASDVRASHRAGTGADRDRLCHVHYGDTAPGALPTCTGPATAGNVVHDAMGSVVAMPTRGGVLRTFEYDTVGRPLRVRQGARTASFTHDAFGDVHGVDVTGPSAADEHHSRRYGSAIELRDGELWRHVPGIPASRRGPHGPWLFPFGDGRGSRTVFGEDEALSQETSYRAFGEATHTGAQPGDPNYLTSQWNGGTDLTAFGCLTRLGARLYDPCLGRFLSRDPLLLSRNAAASNPYAFAANDPQNQSDPSGLDYDLAIWKRFDPISTDAPWYDLGNGGTDVGGLPFFCLTPSCAGEWPSLLRGAQIDPLGTIWAGVPGSVTNGLQLGNLYDATPGLSEHVNAMGFLDGNQVRDLMLGEGGRARNRNHHDVAQAQANVWTGVQVGLVIIDLITLGSAIEAHFAANAVEGAVRSFFVRYVDDVEQAVRAIERGGPRLSRIPMEPQFAGEEARGLIYYRGAERAGNRKFARDGLLHNADGSLYSTDVDHIWVLDRQGRLYARRDELMRVHHSSLAAGEEVIAAGTFRVVNGRIFDLTGDSGHYFMSFDSPQLQRFADWYLEQARRCFKVAGLGGCY
jgi:RHS repeat-associated protein